MLIEDTLFGRIDKVAIAIERLKTFEPPDGYYGATSYGKDSIVIMELAKQAGVKVDWHNNITGIDPPELVRFGRKHYPEVRRHFPKETIWQLITRKHMPPTRGKRFCCEFLKEANGSGRVILLGVRWKESKKRSQRRMVERCYRDASKTYINPIIDWETVDVWEFIRSRSLPYCSLYDEGFTRLGCVGCPSSNIKKEFERWPKIAAQWERVIKRAWLARPVDKKGFESPEQMWEWYVSGTHFSEDRFQMKIDWSKDYDDDDEEDQTVMFE
jgi:phosphoadenosine phosphosulfate reductase